jgi:DNA-binding XRE family transcriptional regulator
MGIFTKSQAQSVNLSHKIKIANLSTVAPAPAPQRVLLRVVIGEVLRARRQQAGRTLREISKDAQVSLGYLSEIERGQKEASSELLASICAALDLSLSALLFDASLEISRSELDASATNLN